MQLSLILLEQLKECFQKCAQVLQFNEWGARPVVVQCNHCQSFESCLFLVSNLIFCLGNVSLWKLMIDGGVRFPLSLVHSQQM